VDVACKGQPVDPETWESMGIVVLSNNTANAPNKEFYPCALGTQIAKLYWGNFFEDNIIKWSQLRAGVVSGLDFLIVERSAVKESRSTKPHETALFVRFRGSFSHCLTCDFLCGSAPLREMSCPCGKEVFHAKTQRRTKQIYNATRFSTALISGRLSRTPRQA